MALNSSKGFEGAPRGSGMLGGDPEWLRVLRHLVVFGRARRGSEGGPRNSKRFREVRRGLEVIGNSSFRIFFNHTVKNER